MRVLQAEALARGSSLPRRPRAGRRQIRIRPPVRRPDLSPCSLRSWTQGRRAHGGSVRTLFHGDDFVRISTNVGAPTAQAPSAQYLIPRAPPSGGRRGGALQLWRRRHAQARLHLGLRGQFAHRQRRGRRRLLVSAIPSRSSPPRSSDQVLAARIAPAPRSGYLRARPDERHNAPAYHHRGREIRHPSGRGNSARRSRQFTWSDALHGTSAQAAAPISLAIHPVRLPRRADVVLDHSCSAALPRCSATWCLSWSARSSSASSSARRLARAHQTERLLEEARKLAIVRQQHLQWRHHHRQWTWIEVDQRCVRTYRLQRRGGRQAPDALLSGHGTRRYLQAPSRQGPGAKSPRLLAGGAQLSQGRDAVLGLIETASPFSIPGGNVLSFRLVVRVDITKPGAGPRKTYPRAQKPLSRPTAPRAPSSPAPT